MSEPAACEECNGTGMKMPEGCAECDSNGWIPDERDGGTIVCPECDGGSSDTCDHCDGTGEEES